MEEQIFDNFLLTIKHIFCVQILFMVIVDHFQNNYQSSNMLLCSELEIPVMGVRNNKIHILPTVFNITFYNLVFVFIMIVWIYKCLDIGCHGYHFGKKICAT